MDLTEESIVRSIMGYLRSSNMYDSLCMMKLETGLSEQPLEPELSYLQGLILEGKWDEVIAYVEPLKQYVPDYNQMIHFIRKHQYLEALSWQGMGGAPPNVLPWRPLKHTSQQSSVEIDADIDMEVVIKILKTLEPITNKDEFNELCHYLTLPRLTDHPSFSDWSISRSRINCFEHLHLILQDIVPQSSETVVVVDLRHAISSISKEVRPSSSRAAPPLRPTSAQPKTFTDLPVPPAPKQPTPPSRAPVAWTVDVEPPPPIENGITTKPNREREIIHIPNDVLAEPRRTSIDPPMQEPRSALSKGTKSGVSFSEVYEVESQHSQHTNTSASTKFTKHTQPAASQIPRNSLGLAATTKAHPMPQYRWESGAPVEDTHIRPQTILSGNCPLRAVEVCKPLLHTERDAEKSVLLAIGSNNKTMHVMAVDGKTSATSSVADIPDIHRGSVYTCDWSLLTRSSSECLLASGSNDKFVRICSPLEATVGGGPPPVKASLKGHNGTVRVVKFSRAKDSTQLASGGAGDCVVRLWDVETGACTMLSKHENHIHGLSWFDSQVIVSGCDSGTIIGHDVRAPNAAWVLNLSSNGICSLSRINRNYILVGHTNGEVSLLHATEQRKLCSYSLHSGDVRSVALWEENALVGSDHALFALTTSYDGYGCVWKLDTTAANVEFNKIALLEGHNDKILSSTVVPFSRDIITTGADGKALLWKPKF